MKCSYRLPALCATMGQSGNGHLTDWSTLGEDTTWVVGPYPFLSTPLIWGRRILCRITMCCIREDCATVTSHSAKLICNLFLSQNVALSSVSYRLYTLSPQFPQMRPAVQTMALVLLIFSRFHSAKKFHCHRQCILDPLVITPH